MGQPKPIDRIMSKPGINRDGTNLSTSHYTDGEWVRFYRGLPKKMGGFKRMDQTEGYDGTIRHVFVYPNRDTVLVYCFTEYEQGASVTGVDLIGSGVKYPMTADSMPVGDFVWSVETMFDALGSGSSIIVAHPGANLESADNNFKTPIFFKNAQDLVNSFEPLTISDVASTTGDMVADSQVLTVADASPYSIGDMLRVTGAGSALQCVLEDISGLVFTLDTESRSNVAGLAVVNGGVGATTGTISAGSNQLTVAVSAGFDEGDVIRVNGAGGTDLFGTITNIVGNTITLNVKAQVAVVGAAVTPVMGTDGGATVLGQYLVVYGSNGLISNSNVNAPQQFNTGDANAANVVGTKIVKGLPMRSGGGGATSGLFWSTDSLIRMTWVGGPAVFKYDVLSSQSSILSPNSAIEYDGRYFWIGVDRFMMFAGSVQEIPNNLNLDDFFDNLNFEHRNKVWATKVPRFGEIWWHYPRGENTECSHVIIYNVRENTWYDTPISRTAGYYSQVFRYPAMADGDNVWFHEYGKDKIFGSSIEAIRSSFTTNDFGLPSGGNQEGIKGVDQWQRLTRVEPDFDQLGEMVMNVITSEYPASPKVIVDSQMFWPNTEKLDMRIQARFMKLQFISNQVGGDYDMGAVLIHTEPGDQRQ